MTCANSGLPPTSCNTLGSLDFRRVPLPAAMMAIAVRGTADVDFFIGLNIPRERQFCVGTGTLACPGDCSSATHQVRKLISRRERPGLRNLFLIPRASHP